MDAFEISSAGTVLRGDDAGESAPGAPAIVLLHGLTATRRYVVMGSRSLERAGHRVIAYDARGHGRSTPSPAGALPAYDYATLADDLRAVMDARGIDRAVLVGASMGAHTLLAFALAHPDRVAGLVVATPAFTPGAQADPAFLARWDRLSDGLREGGVDGFLAAYGEPRVPEAFQATIATVLRQRLSAHDHPLAVADALRHVPRSAPFTDFSALHAIAVPTLVVGDRDEVDPEHPLAIAERYAAEIPGATLEVEAPGASPLAWQGGQLSRLIASVAERASH